ncbi:hypothetical protein [Thermincola ferriacetica]
MLWDYLNNIFKPHKNNSPAFSKANGLAELRERLTDLEKEQKKLRNVIENKCWTIEKVIIEHMHTDKFEINLDAIDVKELSGVLSVGLNYGGKVVKMETQEGESRKKALHENKQSVKQGENKEAEQVQGMEVKKNYIPKVRMSYRGQ